MSYIILRNPKSIASETSIDKSNYYLIYNFEYDTNTECIYKGRQITPEDALLKIKYEGIECRYYEGTANKTKSKFSNDNTDLYKASATVAVVGILGYMFCKN